MSNESAHFLKVRVSRSRYLTVFIAGIHVLALIAGFVNTLPLWLRLILVAIIVFSFIYSLKRYRLVGAVEPITIYFSENNGWSLKSNNQEPVAVNLLISSVITSWAAILNFKTDTGILTVYLLPDSVDKEEFRQLRVWAKVYSGRSP